jgi:hypothetical protein
MNAIKIYQQNNFWVSEIANPKNFKAQNGTIPKTFKFYGVNSNAVYCQAKEAIERFKNV